ncbi:hypothetical protein LX32DRAFT_634590 [Colletotrichum zoysiae]|uniref:Uncharacterized protein n=1 Tax=Colletotrichum zoysiae TaxID=1216348 RepID=A0AAD9HTE1_9PEZI|nr:hypothetical protein LX32DRAFT_634590 [Colletotrichum zoysiae]
MDSFGFLQQQSVSLCGLFKYLFVQTIISLLRDIILLDRINTSLPHIIVSLGRTVSSHPLARTVLAVVRWILETSRIANILGIEPANQQCTSSVMCSICLVELLFVGILAISALRIAMSAARLPTFQRTPSHYAFFFLQGVIPFLWLAMLWWTCAGLVNLAR